MKTESALDLVLNFKGEKLQQKLNEIETDLIGKGRKSIPKLPEVYEAALEVKKISSQIDEIVHATGILKCLPQILADDETIVDLSLAAAASGQGIDLVSNKRIAEFKFSRWQESSNGIRIGKAFSNLVSLYLNPLPLKKELYVFNAAKVISCFQSSKSAWKNVLSKSGGLNERLEKHLISQGISGIYLNDIYSISGVEVFDIADFLK